MAKVGPTFDPASGDQPGPFTQVNAIWDTGATGSVITKRIADTCGFRPTGAIRIHGVHDERDVSTYLVTILLPNNVGISQVTVSEGNLGDAIDMLIGMDIISRGDFAVTNIDGKTTFSYRHPSTECIDFVANQIAKAQSQPGSGIPKPGRNSPCPCGSGKKYKQCHGKQGHGT